MLYFLDTEFNGFGGELMSMGLVREDGKSLYLLFGVPAKVEPWVAENVVPILASVPAEVEPRTVGQQEGARAIAQFLAGDPQPRIVTDWPDDIRYFCQAVIVGPGQMVNIPGLTFHMVRVDAYPTTLAGAVQHNAWWDAMALRERLAA